MSLSSLDQLLAGSGKTAKFETPGDTYTGEIIEITTRQTTNFKTGEPEFWPDGKKKEHIVITIATSEQEDTDDDGHRNVYVKGWGDQLKAFRQAARTLGRSPQIGDFFTATFTGVGKQTDPRFQPPKLYVYEMKAGPTGVDQLANTHTPTATPAATGSGDVTDEVEKAYKLVQLGLTDEQITQATGVTPDVLAAMRHAK